MACILWTARQRIIGYSRTLPRLSD